MFKASRAIQRKAQITYLGLYGNSNFPYPQLSLGWSGLLLLEQGLLCSVTIRPSWRMVRMAQTTAMLAVDTASPQSPFPASINISSA
ncbi:hypothetical protein EAI_05028 [Harpegnathos saltator]|uniref:Uncharacterized protein n=1 Tax=Harpegnathos saltator TaxID=610380 RepID=E2C4N8_HARSA|nr:hypothetical protein EAI_05028 [Harpegnathos saltator]